jgi:Rrf2 family protein
MILTSQEEYGLRCALTLARAQQFAERHGASGALRLGQVAATEGLTQAYAGKMLRVLIAAGLVESMRGRSGGYRLARPARQIRVSEVLQALGSKFYDGAICTANATAAEVLPKGLCVHNPDCAVRSLWSGLQQLVDGYLERTTLAHLIGSEASAEAIVRRVPPLTPSRVA